MTVYATSLQPGLAIAMGCGRRSLDSREDLPPIDALGKTVMIETLGRIVGCARLTGVVTIRGDMHPSWEHPNANDIRRSLQHREFVGPRLWVFEDGVIFWRDVLVEAGERGTVWSVPDDLHEELRTAYRSAKERRSST